MDVEATLAKSRSRAKWPNPRLLYHSDFGDPSIPLDPGRERLLDAFMAGMAAGAADTRQDSFDLVAVGSMKPPPDEYFVHAPVHDPSAPPDSPDAPDEWAMCGWTRHQVLRRVYHCGSLPVAGTWVMGTEPLAEYDTGAEAMAFIRGFANERRRIAGGETMGEHLRRGEALNSPS